MTPVQQREVSKADFIFVEIRFRGQKIIILRLAEQFRQSSPFQSPPDARGTLQTAALGLITVVAISLPRDYVCLVAILERSWDAACCWYDVQPLAGRS
jgi:hypothetical protein